MKRKIEHGKMNRQELEQSPPERENSHINQNSTPPPACDWAKPRKTNNKFNTTTINKTIKHENL